MSKRIGGRRVILRVLGPLALLLPASARADTLIDNIDGLSVDREGHVTRFAAIVVDARGRVVQVLARGDRPGHTDFREDGRGRTVVPGFVDAHVALMALGLAQLTLDLSDTRSLAEAQAKLTAYAAANPGRAWIVGRGWEVERWGLPRLPTGADLDVAVKDRPVWLESADGSQGWANTAALAAAAITARTADPAGGRIERAAGSRAPSGVLSGTAMDLVASKVPPARAADLDVALMKAQDLLARRGVTAVADMGTTLADWMTYRRAGDESRLRMRIVAYAEGVPDLLTIGGSGPTPWLYDDRLRLAGLHLHLDGPLASRAAWLKVPYADAPADHGLPELTGTQLRNLMSRAAMDEFQVAIDAHGDAAVAEALSAIEELAPDYGGDRRWRIEGASVVGPADIPRLGQHGIVASLQGNATSSAAVEARLGAQRASWAYPWAALTMNGARPALGSGARGGASDPLSTVGAVLDRSLNREQALAGFTSSAAYAGFAEGRFGELKAGERADFVMLDADPLAVDPARLGSIQVLQTWIGGIKVYDAMARPANKAGS